jgi:hypothetical protein
MSSRCCFFDTDGMVRESYVHYASPEWQAHGSPALQS